MTKIVKKMVKNKYDQDILNFVRRTPGCSKADVSNYIADKYNLKNNTHAYTVVKRLLHDKKLDMGITGGLLLPQPEQVHKDNGRQPDRRMEEFENEVVPSNEDMKNNDSDVVMSRNNFIAAIKLAANIQVMIDELEKITGLSYSITLH